MVSTKKFCRSGQYTCSVYSLLVISRNHSNTYLLIDLQKAKLFQGKILKKGLFYLISGFHRFWQVFVHSNIQISRSQNFWGHLFYKTPFGWPPLKLVEYLFLKALFFVSLDKSILLCCRCLISKFSEIMLLVCRKIFSTFYLILHETFSNSCGFPLM